MSQMRLIIGNKNYSSWSLRPWIAMSATGIAFEEVLLPLYDDRWPDAVAAVSPTPARCMPVSRHCAVPCR